MLNKPGWFGVLTLLFATSVWSDEPPRVPAVIRQPVDPKVVRKDLALPEFQGHTNETQKVSLDELQRLYDKLKKNVDIEGAELVQRLIHERQQLAKASGRTSVPDAQKLEMNLDVFEVNSGELPRNSIFLEAALSPFSNEARAELDRLLAEKKLKRMVTGVSQEIMDNEAVLCLSGVATEVYLPNGDGPKETEFLEPRTLIRLVPTVTSDERIRLTMTLEISTIDPENAVTLLGTIVPGISKRKLQTTFVVNLGEATILSAQGMGGRGLLILTKVSKKK